MKTKEPFIVNVIICLWLIVAGIFIHNHFLPEETQAEIEQATVSIIPEKLFGFEKDNHIFETFSLKPNESLGELLIYEGISWDSILKLDKVSEDVFSIRRFRAKKPFTLIREDSCSSPTCLVYEPNKLTYIKYDLKDKIDVNIVRKKYEVCEEYASGVIESSLWMSMKDAGIGYDLIDKMEDAMASGVDFYHTQKGDQFKILYEQKYINGVAVDNGEILAASYKDSDGEKIAVYFENDYYSGFYDLEGQPTVRTFLRAPLKHSRISSGYNLRRFHPIKKQRIPHLGTDYAAPLGTPIYAVADGVIEIAGYTKNNGKYIKIRHDNVYQTQYLHMHRFAPNIKKGAKVKQGQEIGQVGQTGLATGPHVCFRFWKNGQQINHLRENFPPKDPLPEAELPDFFKQRDALLYKLAEISYPNDISRNNVPLALQSQRP